MAPATAPTQAAKPPTPAAPKAAAPPAPKAPVAAPANAANAFSGSVLNGSNAVYVDGMYEAWKRDPSSVHASWHVFFQQVGV